jgi:hypothetical protein
LLPISGRETEDRPQGTGNQSRLPLSGVEIAVFGKFGKVQGKEVTRAAEKWGQS